MTIKVGDRLPAASFLTPTKDGPVAKTTDNIFAGKKVVLFAVPGAFTPTCHNNHMPSYVTNFDAFKAKGVDTIAVTAVNDVFVMKAWAEASDANDKILFLADGSADFAKALDLMLDATKKGMGLRSQRYAMLIEDGVVKVLNVEEVPSEAKVSGAEHLLAQM